MQGKGLTSSIKQCCGVCLRMDCEEPTRHVLAFIDAKPLTLTPKIVHEKNIIEP